MFFRVGLLPTDSRKIFFGQRLFNFNENFCFAQIGACAMTTKFLDNKNFTFKILLPWRFPWKIVFWTQFSSLPPCPPPPQKKSLFLMSSRFLWKKFFENPSGHGRPRRKSWTSAPESASFGAARRSGETFWLQRIQGIQRKGQELSGLPNANAKSQRFGYATSQIATLPPVVAL